MDITIKGIPDGITEKEMMEWCSVLVERKENAKLQQIPAVIEAAETAKTNIDSFRTNNQLTAKFVTVPIEPAIIEK